MSSARPPGSNENPGSGVDASIYYSPNEPWLPDPGSGVDASIYYSPNEPWLPMLVVSEWFLNLLSNQGSAAAAGRFWAPGLGSKGLTPNSVTRVYLDSPMG